MTWKWLTATVAALAVVVPPPPARAQEKPATGDEQGQPVLETDQQKLDYGLGVQMGRNLKNQGIEPDVDLVVQGLRDALAGRRPLISEEDLRQTMRAFGAEMRRSRVRDARIAAEENRQAGEAFLAENKTRDGVVTLPNGLQY